MKFEIARNTVAQQLLSDPKFQAEWEALCDRCPWATVFQSFRFARVWWSVYVRLFEPVLLTSRKADGSLAGLLVLARSRTDGSLIVAGGRHAEYQAWVCDPDVAQTFPAYALERVRREFRGARLTFQYLPPGTPTEWLGGAGVGRFCLLRSHRRPVWELGDGSAIAASLKKNNNKNRLRHLKKLGPFEFRRVTDPAEFEQLFDQTIELYDLRHGAVHGAPPFCATEYQKEFHTALFREPGLVHATVMKSGENLAAAHFGVCGKSDVHFGTIVHDPRLARHSPGKVQYLLLAQMLQREGFARADLTPGDDAYKDRHATAWDCAYTLCVCPTALAKTRAAAALRLAGVAKRVLRRRGMTLLDARNRVRRLGGFTRGAALTCRRAHQWLSDCRETRVFVAELAGDNDVPDQLGPRGPERTAPSRATVRVDSWRDLLAYKSTRTGQCRQSFLSEILTSLEAGEHAYTVTEAGKLINLAWTVPPGSDGYDAALAGFAVPPDSLIVQISSAVDPDAFTSTRAAVLEAILREARANPAVRHVVLLAPAKQVGHDLAARFGFVHTGSIRRTSRFGRRGVEIRANAATAHFSDNSAVPPASWVGCVASEGAGRHTVIVPAEALPA